MVGTRSQTSKNAVPESRPASTLQATNRRQNDISSKADPRARIAPKSIMKKTPRAKAPARKTSKQQTLAGQKKTPSTGPAAAAPPAPPPAAAPPAVERRRVNFQPDTVPPVTPPADSQNTSPAPSVISTIRSTSSSPRPNDQPASTGRPAVRQSIFNKPSFALSPASRAKYASMPYVPGWPRTLWDPVTDTPEPDSELEEIEEPTLPDLLPSNHTANASRFSSEDLTSSDADSVLAINLHNNLTRVDDTAARSQPTTTKENLKRIAAQSKISKGRLKASEAPNLTTSDAREEMEDILCGEKRAEFVIVSSLKLSLDRSWIGHPVVPDTVSSAYSLSTVGVAVYQYLEKKYPGIQFAYQPTVVKIKSTADRASGRPFEIDDFDEANEELLLAELEKWREDHPRSKPLISYQIKALTISHKRRHLISSDPSSSPPMPVTKKRKRTEVLEEKVRKKAEGYQIAGDMNHRIAKEHKCEDKNCSNYENICFVMEGKHYNVRAPQQEEWANHCLKGLATYKQPPHQIVSYWEREQGNVARGSLAPIQKVTNKALADQMNGIGVQLSSVAQKTAQLQEARLDAELLAIRRQNEEYERDRRRAELEDRRYDRRENERAADREDARSRQAVADKRDDREAELRVRRLLEDADNRREDRELSKRQPPHHYLPAPTTRHVAYLSPSTRPQEAPPKEQQHPSPKTASSPINLLQADEQHVTNSFFTHQISTAPDDNATARWQSIRDICRSNDWLLDDLKLMSEGEMFNAAVAAGIPYGTAKRMPVTVQLYKPIYRAQEAAADRLCLMGR